MEKKRLDYIDITKYLGIFIIYLAHMGQGMGNSYPIAFHYAVQLFFFIAGCMETFSSKKGKSYFVSKIRTILIPWLFFSLLSLIFFIIDTNANLEITSNQLLKIVKGCIRNQFFAGTLWFLTCLFVISIIFGILRLWNNKVWILCSGIFLCIITEYVLGLNPTSDPQYLWNIDSALYYIVYFTIGYVTFPYINKIFTIENKINKYIILFSGILTGYYTISMFFGNNILNIGKGTIGDGFWIPILTGLLLIWFQFIIGYCLRNIKILANIGRYSLYLCGNEYIIKLLISRFLGMLGLEENLSSPLMGYIYVFIAIFLVYKLLIPIEKDILTRLIKGKSKIYNNS